MIKETPAPSAPKSIKEKPDLSKLSTREFQRKARSIMGLPQNRYEPDTRTPNYREPEI